jgi:diguanylate cyclase (GGDEF)-like protein
MDMQQKSKIEQLSDELEKAHLRIAELEAQVGTRLRTAEELRESQEQYRALFVHNPIETIVVDNSARVTAINLAKQRSGDRLPAIGNVMYRDYAGKHKIDMYNELMGCIRSGVLKEFPELQYGEKYLHIRIAPFDGGAIITSLNITEQKLLEEKLHAASVTDDLTGIFNRRGFLTMADKRVKMADRAKESLFLLYADLDNMKWINDHLRHKTGDNALRETADLLRNTFRQSDIIGRLGGDEFAVLLADKQGTDSEDAVVERFEENIRTLNRQPDRRYQLSISVGVTRYDSRFPCSIEELMSRADALMYECKKRKKDDGLPDSLIHGHPVA